MQYIAYIIMKITPFQGKYMQYFTIGNYLLVFNILHIT